MNNQNSGNPGVNEPAVNNTPGDGETQHQPATPEQTNANLNAEFQKARLAGEQKILRQLGIDDVDSAKTQLEEYKKLRESQMSEIERYQSQANELKIQYEKQQAELAQRNREVQLMQAGVPADNVELLAKAVAGLDEGQAQQMVSMFINNNETTTTNNNAIDPYANNPYMQQPQQQSMGQLYNPAQQGVWQQPQQPQYNPYIQRPTHIPNNQAEMTTESAAERVMNYAKEFMKK